MEGHNEIHNQNFHCPSFPQDRLELHFDLMDVFLLGKYKSVQFLNTSDLILGHISKRTANGRYKCTLSGILQDFFTASGSGKKQANYEQTFSLGKKLHFCSITM